MLRSFYSGISGLKVNQVKLDVLGNNIANAGTTAFKSSRVRFQDMVSQSIAGSTAPGVSQGGVNSREIGLGVQVSGIDTMMGQGAMQPTSRNLDIAMDGEGYLMVAKGATPRGSATTTTVITAADAAAALAISNAAAAKAAAAPAITAAAVAVATAKSAAVTLATAKAVATAAATAVISATAAKDTTANKAAAALIAANDAEISATAAAKTSTEATAAADAATKIATKATADAAITAKTATEATTAAEKAVKDAALAVTNAKTAKEASDIAAAASAAAPDDASKTAAATAAKDALDVADQKVKDTAKDVLDTAKNVLDTAKSANDDAATAKTKVEAADTANKEKAKADAAKTAADTVKTAADITNTNADNAKTKASEASEAAVAADAVAKQAVIEVNTAKDIADINKANTAAAAIPFEAALRTADATAVRAIAAAKSATVSLTTDTKGVELNNDYSVSNNTNGVSLSYTRDGALTKDKNGNLLNSDGLRVLGYAVNDGKNASIDYDNNGNPLMKFVDANGSSLNTERKLVPLVIPNEIQVILPAARIVNPDGTITYTEASTTISKITTFSIEKDGSITAVLEGGKVAVLGQIATSTFKNPAGLSKVGGNLYENSSNSGDAVVRTGSGAATDNSEGCGEMLQGMLEMSNVDLSEQFTDMIIAQRAFQAAGKSITTGDEILQELIGLKR